MPSDPVVGHLDLTFEAMDLTSDPGAQLLAFSVTPGTPSTPSHDGLLPLAARPKPSTSTAPATNAPITTDNADTAD